MIPRVAYTDLSISLTIYIKKKTVQRIYLPANSGLLFSVCVVGKCFNFESLSPCFVGIFCVYGRWLIAGHVCGGNTSHGETFGHSNLSPWVRRHRTWLGRAFSSLKVETRQMYMSDCIHAVCHIKWWTENDILV